MLETMSNRTPAERVLNRRRLERNMRWKDVLDRADGMAAETLRRVRISGTGSVDQLSVARIEKALAFNPGELTELEAREAAGADPLTASAQSWDGEIVGPAEPLLEGEVLRWRRSQTRDTLIYELTVGEVSMATGFYPHETPEDVIDELREGVEQIELRSKQRHRRVRR
jgi:hypothetical protein